MSRKSEVTVTWTCDVCGNSEPEVDGYSPRGWEQIASALISAQLGNVTARHLCADCGENLALLLANRLGDLGDMAQAWDEGYTTGNAHNGRRDANPYRAQEVRP